MELTIVEVPLDTAHPNPWNPNHQSDRQYEAEQESLLLYGVVSPIIVRPHPTKDAGHFEIVDGEHRWRAVVGLVADGRAATGNGNMPHLAETGTIPAVVLNLADHEAKKLTVVMNETRGNADMTELAALLATISADYGEDLLLALPYGVAELGEIMSVNDFDWSELENEVMDRHGDPEPSAMISVVLKDPVAVATWTRLLTESPIENKRLAALDILTAMLLKEEA